MQSHYIPVKALLAFSLKALALGSLVPNVARDCLFHVNLPHRHEGKLGV